MHQLFSCCDKPYDSKQLKGGGVSLGSRVGGEVHHDGQSMAAMEEAAGHIASATRKQRTNRKWDLALNLKDSLHPEGASL